MEQLTEDTHEVITRSRLQNQSDLCLGVIIVKSHRALSNSAKLIRHKPSVWQVPTVPQELVMNYLFILKPASKPSGRTFSSLNVLSREYWVCPLLPNFLKIVLIHHGFTEMVLLYRTNTNSWSNWEIATVMSKDILCRNTEEREKSLAN